MHVLLASGAPTAWRFKLGRISDFVRIGRVFGGQEIVRIKEPFTVFRLGHKIVSEMMIVQIRVWKIGEGWMYEDDARFVRERIHVLSCVTAEIMGRGTCNGL